MTIPTNQLTRRVIGVVGPIASGKGVVIDFFQKKGYRLLSLSDVVRQHTKEWGLELTRKNLQDVGDSLRKKFSPAILAEMIAPEIKKHPNEKFIIDAIRNPAEVRYLKKEFQAVIIGVTAPAEKRFELMQKRARPYDPTTWEDFQKVEQRDRGIGQEQYGQQVEKCLALADTIIDNSGSLEAFSRQIQHVTQD